MKVEERILLEENELKPNRYVANAVLFFLPVLLIVELLNGLGIFHVNPESLHLCTAVILVCCAAIQYLVRARNRTISLRTKFIVMTLLLLLTLFTVVLLSQWAELLVVLPLFLSLQYHNRSVTRFAIFGVLFIALVSAPLSVLFSLPQLDFYEFLIRSIGYEAICVQLNPNYSKVAALFAVFKYISLPRCAFIIALAPTAVYITRLTSGNVNALADVTYLSSHDVMTDLYNRMSYEQKCREYAQKRPEHLWCIYADADGLHALNNQQGHAAGDRLLKTCSKLLRESFGQWTYRIGGDEFVAFVNAREEGDIRRRIQHLNERLLSLNYHLSIGYAQLTAELSIDELVNLAEHRMFQQKRAYYEMSGHDRRRRTDSPTP